MTATARASKAPDRRAMTAKIHIARKDLALADDSYRAVLERITGKTSSKDCSERQLHAVLEEFKRRGWKPQPSRRRRAAPAAPISADEQAAKVRALWFSLWCLGAVDDRSEDAIESYVARMTRSPAHPEGIQRMQWLDARGYDRVIRSLRAWCDRVGFPQPTGFDVEKVNRMRVAATFEPAPYGYVCKVMLFRALWNRLLRAGAFRHDVFAREATFVKRYQPAVVAPEYMDPDRLDAACSALGEWWRRVKAEQADG